jgi:hypothetical protein
MKIKELKIWHNIFFWLASFLLLPSCLLEDPDDCCYNVSLEYHLKRYGTLGENELGYYVHTMNEYVFDERNVLIAINNYDVPHGDGNFFSEQELKKGRYSVVTFGNRSDNEVVELDGDIPATGATLRDAENGEVAIGTTTMDNLILHLEHPFASPQDVPYASETYNVQGASAPLYYGYRSFEVGEFGISHLSMDMTNGHCLMGITAKWIDNSGHPLAGEQYTFVLKHAHAKYHFKPEYLVNNGIDPDTFIVDKELFPINDNRRINYIPNIDKRDLADHVKIGSVNGNTLSGQFTTFRYRTDSHVLLSIWSSTGKVMKEIDLYRFFQETGIDLDHALWQEYNLQIEINGDEVRVGMVQIMDWEYGGDL